MTTFLELLATFFLYFLIAHPIIWISYFIGGILLARLLRLFFERRSSDEQDISRKNKLPLLLLVMTAVLLLVAFAMGQVTGLVNYGPLLIAGVAFGALLFWTSIIFPLALGLIVVVLTGFTFYLLVSPLHPYGERTKIAQVRVRGHEVINDRERVALRLTFPSGGEEIQYVIGKQWGFKVQTIALEHTLPLIKTRQFYRISALSGYKNGQYENLYLNELSRPLWQQLEAEQNELFLPLEVKETNGFADPEVGREFEVYLEPDGQLMIEPLLNPVL